MTTLCKRPWLALALLLAALLGLSCSPREVVVDDDYQRGVSALDRQDYDQAVACFSEAIRRHPRDAMAYNNRGFAYALKGEYPKALADYDQALRLNPAYALAHYNRADAYFHQGDRGRAIDDYTAAIRLDPRMADAYNNRGSVHLVEGQHERALADFNEAIRLNPKHAKALVNRASVYAQQGDYGRAIGDYRAAVELDAKLVGARNGLAWLLATCPDQALRNGPEAVQCATLACELTGWKNPDTLATLAAACAEAGRFDEAVKWQSEAIKLLPAGDDPADAQKRLELYQAGKPYREEPSVKQPDSETPPQVPPGRRDLRGTSPSQR